MRGPESHIVLHRRGAPDIYIKPAGRLTNPQRLREVIETHMTKTDGELPGLKGGHLYAVAHVVRMLCDQSELVSVIQETNSLVASYIAAARPVFGFTIKGDTTERYEVLDNLRPEIGGLPQRYLIDSDDGACVIRVDAS